jgi:hypothetical protein
MPRKTPELYAMLGQALAALAEMQVRARGQPAGEDSDH